MLATVESKNHAVSKLEALIERGRSRAANVIDHVMRNQPTDRLARAKRSSSALLTRCPKSS